MSKSHIIYKDVAPGAAEDAAFSSTAALSASDLLLAKDRAAAAYITLEHNRWLLDGSFENLADNTVAFWSAELSGEGGKFTTPPSIEIAFDERYSSVGLTLVFDRATGEYCTGVNIQWYQGDTLLSSADFTPNAVTYFCENQVVGYDKIVITITETMLPGRRARIDQISFGTLRQFDMTELRQVQIVNEMDVSSIELPVSNMSWSIDTRDTVAFMFQLKQPVECWNDDSLIGVYYIDSHKRNGVGRYSISCNDALGVLDESPFAGGIYTDKSAQALLLEIVDGDFDLLFEVEDTAVTGAILASTKREAMQQVLFATGWCVSTDGQAEIRVFDLPEEPADLGKGRTFTGVQVETSAIVTAVTVLSHTYTQDSNGSVEIGGVKYADTTAEYTVSNPNVTANDKKNVKEIKNATLVSPAIGQAVAQRIYDYFLRRNNLTARFVWRGEKLGDCVTQPTPWDTTETGHLEKMEIRLSNTVVATGEALGV